MATKKDPRLEEVKAKFKRYWDFMGKNLGTPIVKVPIGPGVVASVECSVFISGGYLEWDSDYTKLELSKSNEEFCKTVGIDPYELSHNIDTYSELVKYFEPLQKEFSDIHSSIDWTELEEYDVYYDNDPTQDYKDFNQFWSVVKEAAENQVNKTTVKLNGSYVAVVTKDSDIVQVGCQKFDIESIENIVKAHKTLNSAPKIAAKKVAKKAAKKVAKK